MASRIFWRNSDQFSDTKSALHFFQNAYSNKQPPRGLIWLVHGLGEHLQRYGEFAQFLNQAGFDVAGIDLPGHGLSWKKGGQDTLPSIEESIREIKDSIRFLHKEHYGASLNSRWSLMGHSMGALISLCWTLDEKRLDANESFAHKLVLSAPPLELRLQVPPYKIFLAEKLKETLPNLKIDGGFYPKDLSHDLVQVFENAADPMCYAKATPKLFVSLRGAAESCLNSYNSVDVPTMLVVGEKDPIVQPSAIEKYFEKLNTSKKLIKVNGAFHETLNELNRKDLYEGVLSWLQTSNS
ncbi:alpha/beta hydrolase [bacterium]|nr:alpha/beta hydrolase [bacterium]